jgi:hypothetical protein
MKKFIPVFFSSLILISCSIAGKKKSSDVDQSKINVVYSASWNGTDNRGSAGATFNLDAPGKPIQLQLNGKSSITYNGGEMKGSTVPILGGWGYNVDLKSWPNKHEFVYVDNEGTSYTLTASMAAISFAGDPSWNDSLESLVITLDRDVEPNEHMWVYFMGDSALESESIDVQDTSATSDCFFDHNTHTITISSKFFESLPTSTTAEMSVTMLSVAKEMAKTPPAGCELHITYEIEKTIRLPKRELRVE